MKRVVRWMAQAILMVHLCLLLVLLLFYLPPVQQWVAQVAARWLSGYTQTEVHIQRLRLHFPLRCRIEGISMAQRQDTLLALTEVHFKARLGPLLERRVEVEAIRLKELRLATDTLFPHFSVEGYVQEIRLASGIFEMRTDSLTLARARLQQGYLVVRQSAKPSPSPSAKDFPLRLKLQRGVLQNLQWAYYADWAQWQVQGEVGQLTVYNTRLTPDRQMDIASFQLERTRLSYQSYVSPREENRYFSLENLLLEVDSIRYQPAAFRFHLAHLSFYEGHGFHLVDGRMQFRWDDQGVQLSAMDFSTPYSSLRGALQADLGAEGFSSAEAQLNASIGKWDVLAALPGAQAQKLQTHFPEEPLQMQVAMEGSTKRFRLLKCRLSFPQLLNLSASGSIENPLQTGRRQLDVQWKGQLQQPDRLTALLDSAWQKQLQWVAPLSCKGTYHLAGDSMWTILELRQAQDRLRLQGGYQTVRQSYSVQADVETEQLHELLPRVPVSRLDLTVTAAGRGFAVMDPATTLQADVRIDSLRYQGRDYEHLALQLQVAQQQLQVDASFVDSLMRVKLQSAVRYSPQHIWAQLDARVSNLQLLERTVPQQEVVPSFFCHFTMQADSLQSYRLRGRLYEIQLETPTEVIRPQPINIRAMWTPDSFQVRTRAGDLSLTVDALPSLDLEQWIQPLQFSSPRWFQQLPRFTASVEVGTDNPLSNYLSLLDIRWQRLTASVEQNTERLAAEVQLYALSAQELKLDTLQIVAGADTLGLSARLSADWVQWNSPLLTLRGTVQGVFSVPPSGGFSEMAGQLHFQNTVCTLPAYSLQLSLSDTAVVDFRDRQFRWTRLPVFAAGKQPLWLTGFLDFASFSNPWLQLGVEARKVDLLQHKGRMDAQLYGHAWLSGQILLKGPLSSLALSGQLALQSGSSIHYLYRNLSLRPTGQLSDLVTFTDFSKSAASSPVAAKKYVLKGFSMNLNVDIDPTVLLNVALGAGSQNYVSVQGGGPLQLQYTPMAGFRIAGKYTATAGTMRMALPLIPVRNFTIQKGSSLTWSGNAANPLLSIIAEDRLRASVTLNEVPQSVLFLAGVSLTESMDRLGIRFTLSAPENAAMQNQLSALSPEERSKLSVALLTTGLYLGEGGSGNLMNSALASFLQSQLDNVSRNTFKSVNVSFDVEPLSDGYSGISTRTNYSFQVSKRFWDDRLNIVVGGSVSMANEEMESDFLLDNVSIEWRLTPNGSQYVRFFYDKNYESILEGEIREAGVGYVYRRQLTSIKELWP